MTLCKAVVLCACLVVLAPPVSSLNSFLQELRHEFTALGKDVAKSLIRVGMDAVNRTVNIGCKTACPRLCQDRIGMYFCPFVCMPLCNRGKRSIRQRSDYAGHLVPMPNKFSAYDLNDDGWVSLKELAFVSGHQQDEKDLKTVFRIADKNGDKMLSPKELYEGPFVFEMDISDTDYEYCQYIESRRGSRVSHAPSTSNSKPGQ